MNQNILDALKLVGADNSLRIMLFYLLIILFLALFSIMIYFIFQLINFKNYKIKEIEREKKRYLSHYKKEADDEYFANHVENERSGDKLFSVLSGSICVLLSFFILFSFGLIDAYKVAKATKEGNINKLLALSDDKTKYVREGLYEIGYKSISFPQDIEKRIDFYHKNFYLGLESETDTSILKFYTITCAYLIRPYWGILPKYQDLQNNLVNNIVLNKYITQSVNCKYDIKNETRENFIYYLIDSLQLPKMIQKSPRVNITIDHEKESGTSTFYVKHRGASDRTARKVTETYSFTNTIYSMSVNDSIIINSDSITRFVLDDNDWPYPIDSLYRACCKEISILYKNDPIYFPPDLQSKFLEMFENDDKAVNWLKENFDLR